MHLGVATGRVPPGWSLENDAKYPLRHWRQDIEVWAASTDVPEARLGPACAQRITGAAKIVVREIPIGTLINGGLVPDAAGNPVQLTGIGMLLRILERRYGAAPQEVQIHALSEFMGFVRGHHESTDAVLARFEILLNKAELQGGFQFGPQIKAWLLLSHLRIPRTSWFTLLAPTQGMLPGDDPEYVEFAQYLRRNGHMYDKVAADPQKTLAQPYYSSGFSDEPSSSNVHPGNWAFPTWNQTDHGETFPQHEDDGISWHSFSTGRSDDDEPILWEDWDDIPPAHVGEAAYLAYRGAKRRWRSFAGKGRPRFKGRSKSGKGGKGAGKGGKSSLPRTFWTDDFGNHHVVSENPAPADVSSVFFKGKGKGNPIGKDGKVMLCSICHSDQHFRAKCSKGVGKGGSGSGKANVRTFFMGPDVPEASSSHVPEAPPVARPTYFAMPRNEFQPRSALSEFSHIYFEDGTPAIALTPVVRADALLNVPINEPEFPNSVLMNSSMYYPVWGNSAYHARVRLDQGEAMLVDTGAVGNLSGDLTVRRMEALAKARGHGTEFKQLAKATSVDGVGASASTCVQSAIVPIALPNGQVASYQAALIENSEVPALLGLSSLTEKRVLLDTIHDQLIMVGPGGFEIKLSPGSQVMQCKRSATGHLMLPCSQWDQVKSFAGGKQTVYAAVPGNVTIPLSL